MSFKLGSVIRFKGPIDRRLKQAIGCAGHTISYPRMEEAQDHIDRLEARDQERAQNLVTFKCPVCGGFHVGHKRA